MEKLNDGCLILPRGLFTGEAVEEFVVFNKDEVDAHAETDTPVKPRGAYFDLLPVSGEWDAEYTKKRGHDSHTMRVKPRTGDDGPNMEFDGMDISFSNEREISAMAWLFKRVCQGWRGIQLDDGSELAGSGENIEKMAKVPQFAKPVIDAAYALGRIKDEVSAGNS